MSQEKRKPDTAMKLEEFLTFVKSKKESGLLYIYIAREANEKGWRDLKGIEWERTSLNNFMNKHGFKVINRRPGDKKVKVKASDLIIEVQGVLEHPTMPDERKLHLVRLIINEKEQ